MIIYNVTCSMDANMAPEWIDWMMQEHIPEVMATGCFTAVRVMKMLTNVSDDSGVNYAIQYSAQNMDMYNRYQEVYGPALRQKTMERYGDKVIAFRTLLEEIGN